MRVLSVALVVFSLVLAMYTICQGDIVYLNTGGVVRGKILERDMDKLVVRTPYGLTTIPVDDIDYIEEGGSFKQMYEERLKQIKDDDVQAHYNLGVWLRNVGMCEEAKSEFGKVIKLDPDHEEARCELGYTKHEGKWLTEEEYMQALGYVEYKARWVTKEDLERYKAGYVKYKNEWVKEEDLPKLKKGLRKHQDKWVSEEQYYKLKGYEKYKGRWLPKKKVQQEREKDRKKATERKKRGRRTADGRIVALKFKVVVQPDADDEFLSAFGKKIQAASARLWTLTQGQMYVSEATIEDRWQTGNMKLTFAQIRPYDVVVQNLDKNGIIKPDGRKVYASASGVGYSGITVIVGGRVDPYTFCHELCHAKLGLKDEYEKKGQCIMAGAGGAWKFCPECLEKIKRKFTKWKFPNKGFKPKPPETKVHIANN